jgi:hypothetical protein
MSNIKPIILVNETNSPLDFAVTQLKAQYRSIVVPDESGVLVKAEEAYEVRMPDSGGTVEIPPSLDIGERGAKPGYAVLKAGTYARLTSEANGYPDFESTWANARDGFVSVLKDAEAERFVAAWDIDVKAEAQ